MKLIWTKLGQIPAKVPRQGCKIGYVGLPASRRAAHASRPLDVQRHMRKLSGDVIGATQKFAVNDYADTHAVRHADIDKVLWSQRLASLQPKMSQRASPSRIFNLHR